MFRLTWRSGQTTDDCRYCHSLFVIIKRTYYIRLVHTLVAICRLITACRAWMTTPTQTLTPSTNTTTTACGERSHPSHRNPCERERTHARPHTRTHTHTLGRTARTHTCARETDIQLTLKSLCLVCVHVLLIHKVLIVVVNVCLYIWPPMQWLCCVKHIVCDKCAGVMPYLFMICHI